MGENGSGKSHLVNAIVNYIMHVQMIPSITIESKCLFRELKPGASRITPLTVEELISVPVLGLNDIAAVRTDWELSTILEIVDGRQGKTLVCSMDVDPNAWIQSQFKANEMRGVNARRIWSRINGLCEPIVVPPDAIDYRPVERERAQESMARKKG